MKKLQILFFATLFLLSSCSKNDDNSPPQDVEEGTLTAIIGGEEFKTNIAGGAITIGTNDQLFAISGPDNLKALVLGFSLPLGESLNASTYENIGEIGDCVQLVEPCLFISYTITNPSNPNTLSGGNSIEPGDVQVTFSSIDYRDGGHAIGTFSGVLNGSSGQIGIHDGKFNVKI